MAPLEIRTFPGAGGGMDQAGPAHMLPDSKARWIIDGLVDRPGLVRQRGKMKGTDVVTSSPIGMASTYSPDGLLRIAIAFRTADSTGGVQFLDRDNAATGSWAFTPVPGFTEVWHSSGLLGGTGKILSWAQQLSGEGVSQGTYGMAFWRGGGEDNYSTGTITCARGGTSVTGSGTTWTSNVAPGQFVLRNNGSTFRYLGVVKSVNSNTSITLEDVSIGDAPASSNYLITSLRGISPRHVVGRISGAAGQTIINGTGTKFRDISPSNTYALYRQRDLLYLGSISTIQSDTQLTLNQNIPANSEVANDKYLAVKIDDGFVVDTSTIQVGILTALWNNRQFYANYPAEPKLQSKVFYSSVDDPEGLNFSKTEGWNIDVPSSTGTAQPILAMASTPSALVIFKESEVFTVKGTVDPNTWQVDRLTENGLLCPMAVANYGDGVIWASDAGIFHYDGQTVKNLVEDSLGDFWIKGVKNFEPANNRMYAMIERDHYFLHIDNAWEFPSGGGYFKGSTENEPASITVCLNLRTEAVTLLTNIGIRGHTYVLPTGSNEGTTRFIVKRGSNGHTYITNGINIFYDEGLSASLGGADDFACENHSVGPDFYIESARYDMDDPQLRKLWKQIQIHYISTGQALHLDTVTNFDTNGVTSSSAFAASGVFINKRFKFLKRSQMLAFRLYSKATGGADPATDVQLGPWAIGFKRQRPGRV